MNRIPPNQSQPERLFGIRGAATGDNCDGWIEFKFSTGRAVRFDNLRINHQSLHMASRLIGSKASPDDLLAAVKQMTADYRHAAAFPSCFTRRPPNDRL